MKSLLAKVWPWSHIRELEIDNWKLQEALGYSVPSRLYGEECTHAYRCSTCAARASRILQIERANLEIQEAIRTPRSMHRPILSNQPGNG